MKLEHFVSQLRALGIGLAVSPAGGLLTTGSKTVIDPLIPLLQTYKAHIIDGLKHGRIRGGLIYRDWKVFFPNGRIDHTTSSAIDEGELLSWLPGAVRVAQYTPNREKPSEMLSNREERALTNWFRRGGEADLGAISRIIDLCNNDRTEKTAWLAWMNDSGYQCQGFSAYEP